MDTKKCATCKQTMPLSDFVKTSAKKCGVTSYCKRCNSLRLMSYGRTLAGKISSIYSAHVRRSKTFNYPIGYSRKEFTEYIIGNELFATLYRDWVLSGFSRLKSPSVDRIDDYKGYCFDNIQLMTWGDNKLKGELYRKTGKNNKANRAVIGTSIATGKEYRYHSLCEAGRITRAHVGEICLCCQGKVRQALGYVWRYAND